MNSTIAGLLYQNMIVYVEDLRAYESMYQEQLKSLEKFFQFFGKFEMPIFFTETSFDYVTIFLQTYWNLWRKKLKSIKEFPKPTKTN